ncbi:MAG: MBL fold metallo-hydrolase [Candidatus Aminicenantes bacterium]|nr:MBL fold metallo-hydrolase [Candidatus Aminicenantes bacterium]
MKKRALVIMLLCLAASAGGQELLEAVKTGDLDKVRLIVERNPGVVNVPNQNGETILFAAITPGGRAEIVEYLISKGANVNQMNNFYMAPLHLACRRGLPLEIVRLLVEHGADVNAVSKYQGRPLDMAYEKHDEPIIAFLTSKGAILTPLKFETFKLADGIHRIAYPWGMRNNLVVSSGPDGALVIDTGFSARALDTIRKIVDGLGRGGIRYVVNTHSHGDHVAGNALAPSEEAVIGLGNIDAFIRLGLLTRSDRGRQGPRGKSFPAPYLMTWNSEAIELIPCPGLHSEADILIHFPKAGVLCMGDLLLSQSCPAVQDVAGYLELLDKVLDVFPPGTTFISGHGRDLDAAGLRKYKGDLAAMAAMVRKEFAAGRTADDMARADLLKVYKAEYSQLDWLGPDSWIRTVVRGLQAGKG